MSTKTYTAGVLAIGAALIYSLWHSAGPTHIGSLKSQDGRFEIVFDGEGNGRLQEHKNDGQLIEEPVSIQFENPGSYKIRTRSHGQLEFISDTRGPLIFTCQNCSLLSPTTAFLWIVTKKG